MEKTGNNMGILEETKIIGEENERKGKIGKKRGEKKTRRKSSKQTKHNLSLFTVLTIRGILSCSKRGFPAEKEKEEEKERRRKR